MKEEVRKQLGKPKNDLEKDTLNYIDGELYYYTDECTVDPDTLG